MIQVQTLRQHSSLKEQLENFNPKNETWIVSDLHTKLQVQNHLLKKQGYYREDSVLRASDFWKQLFKRLFPQVRLVNDQLLKVLLRDILKNRSQELQELSVQSEKTLLSYLNHFSGVLLHPTGFQQVREWLQEYPASAQKWENWLIISRICLFLLLDEKKVMSPRWIPGILQRDFDAPLKWDKDLIFDLGCHLNFAEAEVIKKLNQHNGIRVIQPDYDWVQNYQYLLRPYESLSSKVSSKKSISSEYSHQSYLSNGKKASVLRMTTQLAEVKWAVAQVRRWLEDGIDLNSILIVAPEIEVYWPALQYFFEIEGVPVKKASVLKLQDIPSVSHWLSTLRTQVRHPKVGDLEGTYFSQNDVRMTYERFRSLFSRVYGSEDLERSSEMTKLAKNSFFEKSHWNVYEFITIALKDWKSQNHESLELILKEILMHSSSHLSLAVDEWLYYLENICAQKEIVIREASLQGIECLKIQSALNQEQKYRICLGLSDEGFKVQSLIHLSQNDYFALSKDLDFVIENPEVSHLEFDLRVFLGAECNEIFLTFSETDFNGTILNPSQAWLQLESEKGLAKAESMLTRADEIMLSNHGQDLPLKIQRDLGQIKIDPILTTLKKTISPSKLDDYNKCQFIFSAKNVFKLEDEPLVDLDLDHRTRGIFAHGLFEKLISNPLRTDWTSAEIEDILEKIVVEHEIVFADRRIWKAIKKKQVQLAFRFLKFEQEQRDSVQIKNFTSLKEHDILIYFNPETLAVTAEPVQESWTLKCRVDRIDQAQGLAVIYDYKSSPSSAPSQNDWLKKKKLQLLFYTWAYENASGHKSEVIGFFYYIFKPFKISGFALDEKRGLLGPKPGRAKKDNTQQFKAQLIESFETELKAAIAGIEKGIFDPLPLDLEECTNCKWKILCRAPHLL